MKFIIQIFSLYNAARHFRLGLRCGKERRSYVICQQFE